MGEGLLWAMVEGERIGSEEEGGRTTTPPMSKRMALMGGFVGAMIGRFDVTRQGPKRAMNWVFEMYSYFLAMEDNGGGPECGVSKCKLRIRIKKGILCKKNNKTNVVSLRAERNIKCVMI